MIKFLLGLFIGTFIGITIMCILQVSKDNEEWIKEKIKGGAKKWA